MSSPTSVVSESHETKRSSSNVIPFRKRHRLRMFWRLFWVERQVAWAFIIAVSIVFWALFGISILQNVFSH